MIGNGLGYPDTCFSFLNNRFALNPDSKGSSNKSCVINSTFNTLIACAADVSSSSNLLHLGAMKCPPTFSIGTPNSKISLNSPNALAVTISNC